MKPYFKIILIITIGIGGIFMANHYGGCNSPQHVEYSSEDSQINIKMDYVSDWRLAESRGSYGSYAQVQFYGAVKDGFAPSISVTVERSSKVSFSPMTIEGLADDLIQKRMKLKDIEVLLRTDRSLLDSPAIDITLTYKKPKELRSIQPEFIPFRERVVVVQKDGRFYTIRYVVPEQEYDVFEADFLHCLETLRLKE